MKRVLFISLFVLLLCMCVPMKGIAEEPELIFTTYLPITINNDALVGSLVIGQVFWENGEPAYGWATRLATVLYCDDGEEEDCYFYLSGSTSPGSYIDKFGNFLMENFKHGFYVLLIHDPYSDRYWIAQNSDGNYVLLVNGHVNVGIIIVDPSYPEKIAVTKNGAVELFCKDSICTFKK